MGDTEITASSAVGLDEPWALRNGAWIIWVGGGLTLLVGALAIFVLPTIDIIVGDFTGGDLQSARADLRSSGLSVAAGIGVTTAGLLAWGRIELSRREHRLAEQSQRNDRFAAAVELLGHEDPSVRLGGLYALEGLARDGHDRQTIYDIICAYARNHRPLDKQVLSHPPDDLSPDLNDPNNYVLIPAIENRTVDYEAAITIATRSPEPWNIRVDLTGILIANRVFFEATLTNCRFKDAVLTDCGFEFSTLDNCVFSDAVLTHCRFEHDTLDNCSFNGATLDNCSFNGAIVASCSFTEATLTSCSFTDGQLVSCHFNQAVLTNCFLADVTLDDCSFSHATLDDCSLFDGGLANCSFNHATLNDCNYPDATCDFVTSQSLTPPK